jgi:hypothetical protein
MRTIFKNENRQREFLTKGYTKIRLLSEDQVRNLLDARMRLCPDDNLQNNTGFFACPQYFTANDPDIGIKRKTNDLFRDILLPKIDEHLFEYKMTMGQFAIKVPGSGYLHPHQNFQSVADLNDTATTVFCPLVDTDEVNGSFHLVEGSHKISQHIFAPSTFGIGDSLRESIEEKYSIAVPLKAGESLFFDDTLIHWSPPNNSKVTRPATVTNLIPRDAVQTVFYVDPDNPKYFEIFEIDSAFYVDHPQEIVRKRPSFLNKIGFVENRNRRLNETEFEKLLANGEKTRNEIYFPNSQKTKLQKLVTGIRKQFSNRFRSSNPY